MKIKLGVKSFARKMRNKSLKVIPNRLKVFRFAFALCLWINKFQPTQGLLKSHNHPQSPAPITNGVYSQEEMPEGLENWGATTESLQNLFDVERNVTRPWVPKCCNLTYGFTFENKSLCVKTQSEFLPYFEDWPDYSQTAKNLPVKARYEYFIGDPCAQGKYAIDLTAFPDDKYSIYKNGSLFYFDRLHDKEEFCLETLNGTVAAFICFGAGQPDRQLNLTYIVYAIALLISIPFLLSTALIYLCMENFRDLRGKSLSCHVLCLATGYMVLATVQLSSDQLDEALCTAAGFIIQFFFVASFFWLNIICYDTWRSINDDFRHVFRPTHSRSEKIIFFKYSLYGWYGPVVLSIITLIMDIEPAIPESYLKPNFGLRSCWFNSDDAALPYFYGPIAVIIVINIIFFVMSTRKIYLEQKRKQECEANDRNSMEEIREINQCIRLYTKTLQECIYLFCVMGINWTAEILSWAFGGSQMIWLITDAFNALQGVTIFYLFVIKPQNVRNELKHRIWVTWKKIIKCNRHYEEGSERFSRHWHAKLHYEMEEYVDDENYKCLPQPPNITTTSEV